MQLGVQLLLDIAPPAPPPPAPPPPPRPPPYAVRLRDSDLGPRERAEAEQRFSKALEEKLGLLEQVRDLLRLLQEAEFLGQALTAEEQALAMKWQRAHLAARLVGLQNLASVSGAWFEVKAR